MEQLNFKVPAWPMDLHQRQLVQFLISFAGRSGTGIEARRNLPSRITRSVNVSVGVIHFEGDNGGFGLGLVIVARNKVGGGDGIEIALRSVRSGDGGAGGGQSSGDGDDLHFDCLREDLCWTRWKEYS